MRTPTAHTSALMLTTILLAVDTGGCMFNPTCEQLFTCNEQTADGGDASALGGQQAGGALGAGGAIGTGGGAGLGGSAGANADTGQGQGQADAGKVDAAMADVVNDTRDGSLELADASDSGVSIDEADVIPPADVYDAGPTCNPNASPRDPSCPVDPEGIFVSPDGVDTNAGTKDKPLGTLSAGIGKAKAIGKPVFVCTRGNGTADFTKPVVIDSAAPGTRLYGGYSCTDWHYLGQGAKTRVKTAAGEIPLTLQNATGIAIDDFAFEAADATADGGSSIAAFVTNSSTVSLARTTLKAGKGKKGAAGKLTSSNYDLTGGPPYYAKSGNAASGATGGASQICTCAGGLGTTTGGKGGDGKSSVPANNGEPGSALPAPQPAAGAGGEGETATNGGCTNAKAGANAPTAANGHGATTAGQLTAQGWTGAAGAAGATGGPGQGGGGGGGTVTPVPVGGSGGGCGGCGGLGGPGGSSGGSSFALLSYGSLVTLASCSLEASLAGDGGRGADGQAGQLGGQSGSSSGCAGRSGGTGGQGGIGGGGAGGLSVGVGYHGAKPTYSSDTTVTVPTQIAHGTGTGADAGSSETQGAEGQSVQDLSL